MKKKYVLWGVGIVITVISIMVTFNFQISKLSKAENMDLWKRTKAVKQKSEDLANNAKAQFFWRTAQQDIEDILEKATRPDDSKEDNVLLLSQAKAEKEATSYLLSQRISKQCIENMQNLGFSSKTMVEMWKVCNSPEERIFLLHMMEGTKESYGQAFQIDPDKLSDSLTVFMGKYSIRLVQNDENGAFTQDIKEQFENFNNAILSSEKMYYYKKKDGSLVKSKLRYRDIYLQRMYISSNVEMAGRVLEVSLMDPKDTNYAEYFSAYVKDMAVLNLWGTEILLVDKIDGQTSEKTYQLSIHGLEYEKNTGFSLNMRHYSSHTEKFVDVKVHNTLLWQSNNIDNTWSLISLKELLKEKADVKKNIVRGVILIGAIALAFACILWWKRKKRQRRGR